MKRISIVLTAAAVMAATTFLGAPAQAGGIKISVGHKNHSTHSSHKTFRHNNHNVHNNHRTVVTRTVRNNHQTVCRGYYTNQSYQYWVNGYQDQRWVDTSRWVVQGLKTNGQANHVWVTDGYYDSFWVNGYWATGYKRVWVGDGCNRCRHH